ncbi:NAD(P)H-dependent oxidoreductase subunit E [Thiolapillus sp.]
MSTICEAVWMKWGAVPSSLLQVLIEIQDRLPGGIPDEALDTLAEKSGLPKAEIRGIIEFYSFLHLAPHGQYDVLFSDNITDRIQGNQKLVGQFCRLLDIEPGKTRADQRLSLGFTSCTGMSDQGPALLVNGLAIPRLTSEKIATIARLVEAGQPIDLWPRTLFEVDANIQRTDILLQSGFTSGAAVQHAREIGSEAVLDELERAGLRGRGGAGFPTARKWRFCRDTPADKRVVVCNADEGEPGTFKDRVLLQHYFDRLIEGMRLCAETIGAATGFIYLRGEYRYLMPALQTQLQAGRNQGLLGKDFDIRIHLGAGAYICGEESALLESLEGKRGIPRNRPPFPVNAGYLGLPTVVNNVESFVAAAMILEQGADWFLSRGTDTSVGTKLLSISGDCARPGIYEYPFGISIRKILEDCGATDPQMVQIAGAAGTMIGEKDFDRCISFDDVATGGSFMIFDQTRDLFEIIANFIAFFVHESCGFCTPCRVGTSLLQKRFDKLLSGRASRLDLEKMRQIGALMKAASHCSLGATASNALLDSLKHFPAMYEARLGLTQFEPAFDLEEALREARTLAESGAKS